MGGHQFFSICDLLLTQIFFLILMMILKFNVLIMLYTNFQKTLPSGSGETLILLAWI